MRIAAIYARVSSEQQREERTIASQTAALIEFAKSHELEVPKEWVFEDDGFSGATLERPGLERVRDLAAEGQIQVVLAYAPDRLSRKYAYQILLIEEFARQGVDTLFVKAPQSASAEDQLLVQFQGMIRRVRAGADPGALPPRQAASGPLRRSECVEWCAVRISVYPKDRRGAGLVCGHRRRGPRGAARLCDVHRRRAQHGRDRASAQCRRYPNAQAKRPLGALGRVGDAAQSRLSRRSLFRQDSRRRPHSRHAGAAPARWHRVQSQYRPRASARGVDRDPGARTGERGELRASPGTPLREQTTIAAPHDHAERRAGVGQLPEVRLRVLPHLDLHDSA